jgi:hypothetical protein
MSLADWRKTDANVTYARELMRTSEFQMLLGVIAGEAPRGFPLRGEKVTDIQAAIELGRHEGYLGAIDVFYAAASFQQKHEQIPADYGSQETPDQP